MNHHLSQTSRQNQFKNRQSFQPDLEAESLALEEKISKLAKAKGFSQSQLAEKINISRVSVNRFFKGRSSIRTRDLVQLLRVLDIDLDQVISEKMKPEATTNVLESSGGGGDIYDDLISVMENLDHRARSSVFEQVIWWGRCVLNEPARKASDRLHSHFRVSSSAAG